MPGHYIQAKIPPNASPPPLSPSSSSTFPNTYTSSPSYSHSSSHHTPQPDERRPLLPQHSQPQPNARTWWGRNWRPIRFFFLVFCFCWFVIPWIWGFAWWLVSGELGHGGPPRFVPGPGYGRPPREREVRRVGIVGAGPAGISAAYALSQQNNLHEDKKFEITIFEQKSVIGGRMALDLKPGSPLPMHGIEIEDVASSELFPKNSLMREKGMKFQHLSLQREGKVETVKVGFWDGKEMYVSVERPVESIGWGEWMSLVLRYGPSVWRARKLPEGTMKSFTEMLKVGSTTSSSVRCREGNLTMEDIVSAAGLSSAISTSGQDRLGKNGISELYTEEIVTPQLRHQLDQDVDEISDLALSLALQREYRGPASWGLGSGRFSNIMKRYLEESKAKLELNTEVFGLRKDVGDVEGQGKWALEIRSGDRYGVEFFDQVIIAAPWNWSQLLFSQADHGHDREASVLGEVYYRPVHVTFVLSTGLLDAKYFGNVEFLPDQMLFAKTFNGRDKRKQAELKGVREISRVRRMYGPDVLPYSPRRDVDTEAVYHLYRILSDIEIKENVVKKWFGSGNVVGIKSSEIKEAYPLLWPRSEGELGGFRVREGLWGTGAGEMIGIGVDLAWRLGEVVAGLVRSEALDEGRRPGWGAPWGQAEDEKAGEGRQQEAQAEVD